MAVTTEQRSTVVGVFEDRRHADNAVSELRQTGFREDQIGVAGRHAEGETPEATTAEPGTHWETGAATGALAGAGLGGLVGLGILAGIIPAIGPVIAGGTLAAILANAAGGAALGGLVGALVGAGLPEEEARYYQSELEAGRTLVTVKADGRSDEAASILRRHGAYDMHTAPGAATAAPASRTAEGGARIQVREEELQAHRQPVETGEVRVRKEAVTEHRTMEVPVQREEVVIERQAPTGEPAASDIGPGEEIRVPVSAEQVTVEKQPVVKEEVTVGKRAVQDTERVGGEVRKEQVRVEREGDVDVRGSGTDKK
jgi:uncharacterized protein (TIGR02271 family)